MTAHKKAARHNGQRSEMCMLLLKAVCIAVQLALFVGGWMLMQQVYGLNTHPTMMVTLLYGMVLLKLHQTFGGLGAGQENEGETVLGQLLAILIGGVAIMPVIALALRRPLRLEYALLMVIAQCTASVIWCKIAARVHARLFPAVRTALIYDDAGEMQRAESMPSPGRWFNVEITLNLNDYTDNMPAFYERIKDMEAVLLCGRRSSRRNDVLKLCAQHGKCVYVRPRINDVLLNTAARQTLLHTPVLVCNLHRTSMAERALKRGTDVLVSSILLLAGAPVFLCIAMAIVLEDGGPVFYRQTRLTKGGREFQMIKFRSMRTDAERDGVARLAAEGDERITRVGRFLRDTHLDELPQLINILRGEMSLVGPRPERTEMAAQYMKSLPEFDMRLLVKAGLTGYAQVHGKYDTTPYDKLQMDLMYIANMSFGLDVKLILQTVPMMLKKGKTLQSK